MYCHCTQFLPHRIAEPRVDAGNRGLLNQQLRDLRERQLSDSISRLTAIEDEVSQRVRQQYEENPYPR